MFLKSVISSLLIGIVFVIGGVTIFAQTNPVSGKVEIAKADGTREPVADALVEVYRTDIKAGGPSAKTNKKGEFNFAGLPYDGTFILSVSAPNSSPGYLPSVKAGQTSLLITIGPGDGSKLLEDDVRKGITAKPGDAEAALSAEEIKKLQAKYEAEKAAVEAKNKKSTETNEIIANALKAGNEAFSAKNYDVAVAKYDEGIAADPVYVGSAPIFYNNRGTALRTRAVDTYNIGIKSTDPALKVSNLAKTKKDFADATTGYLNAWSVLKNAQAADITDQNNYNATKLATLNGSIETFQLAVRTEQVDPATIEAAKTLIPEYLKVETDNTKKAQASITFADLYRISEDRENAIASYKKVLETSPDNIDAMAYVGIVLVDLGWIKDNDKELSQEGANYLLKFVSVAPDTHRLKTGAVEYLDILKAQSIIPVKTAPVKPATRRKP